MSSCAPGTFLQFQGTWPCFDEYTLYGHTPIIRQGLDVAAEAWDIALQATGKAALPRFSSTPESSGATTVVTGPSDGNEFCGSWTPQSNTFEVRNETHPTCATAANRGPIADLLIHEMAHYWGWLGGSHLGHNNGVAGVSDHCTLALPSAGGLNTTICHHNVEGGLAAYGLRTLANPSNFWFTPFVVGPINTSLPDTVHLVVGNTASLQPGNFQTERGGTFTGSWTIWSSNGQIASVSGHTITGQAVGTASISITPNETTGSYLTSAFASNARNVVVKVTAPPLVQLAVQDITVNTTLPITYASTFQWTAVIGTGDATGVTYRWVFEFSDNTPPDSIFVPQRQPGDTASPWIKPVLPGTNYVGAGQSVSQWVHLGSYNIRVKVWPLRDGVAGFPAIRDFTVCPPGEGNNLNGGGGLFGGKFNGTKSPPGTDAVEGCAQ